MKKIWLIIGLITLILLTWFFVRSYENPISKDQNVTNSSPSPQIAADGRHPFSSSQYNISFSHSKDFFVFEKEVGTKDAPQHIITLAEDTQENRDLFEGKVTEAREGPPTITIDIYENTQNQTAQEWLEESTTWSFAKSQATPTTLNNLPGVTFEWSGLYEGQSTVVSTDKFIYVISSTWLDESSPTRREADSIRDTLKIIQ